MTLERHGTSDRHGPERRWFWELGTGLIQVGLERWEGRNGHQPERTQSTVHADRNARLSGCSGMPERAQGTGIGERWKGRIVLGGAPVREPVGDSSRPS